MGKSPDNQNIDCDFDRDVWCILGLPFDNLSIRKTIGFIDDCKRSGHSCIFSTPNLNWVVNSIRDRKFKLAVIKSDLSTIDGSPVLFAAKVLSIPIRERAPGSTLVEHLISGKNEIGYTLFFFGGDEDAAEKAFLTVNSSGSKMKAVGYCNPGRGTIEEMSGDSIIRKINEADPDILLVSLGARKGMAWIDKNRDKIKAGVVSHLGAAIYFISGSVKRAPRWMQRCGIEWIWRIAQEPFLFWRYLGDGIIFIGLLIRRVIPLAIFIRANRRYSSVEKKPAIEIEEKYEKVTIKIIGICNHVNSENVRRCFKKYAAEEKDIILDLSKTDYVDNSFLGLLLLLLKYKLMQKKRLTITSMNYMLRRIFKLNILNDIFDAESRIFD